MKSFLSHGLLVMFICVSCNARSTHDTTVSVKDSVGVIKDSLTDDDATSTSSDTLLFGFYHGVLPCKDCQGIKHTLLLEDSGRFRLEEFVLGRNTFPQKMEGRWSKAGDSLRLHLNNDHIATYYVRGDTLGVRYRKDLMIVDSTAAKFFVVRQPGAADNAAWKKKGGQGIDFLAIGNEPFWNVEIDDGRSIYFRMADLPAPIAVSVVAPVINKDSTIYRSNASGKRIEITIYNEFCNDGMSDNFYKHRVHVKYGNEVFKGCGTYLR